MTRKGKRLAVVAAGGMFLALAAGLTVYALGQKASYFFMPAELNAAVLEPGQRIRLGGLVAPGSVKREPSAVVFQVTDNDQSVPVSYGGLLPDLFREGQGVITEGSFGADGVFRADSVLAKHDETYMPPEVAAGLKAKGVWQDGTGNRP